MTELDPVDVSSLGAIVINLWKKFHALSYGLGSGRHLFEDAHI